MLNDYIIIESCQAVERKLTLHHTKIRRSRNNRSSSKRGVRSEKGGAATVNGVSPLKRVTNNFVANKKSQFLNSNSALYLL